MKTVDTEVVVVGAGPAGCVLAYLLARTGVDVHLVERETDLDREFRGYFFQPLVARLFEQMGVLTQLLEEVAHEKVSKLSVDVFGKSYPAFDFTTLSESPKYGLFLEQPPLLRFIIGRSDEYETFTVHDGTTVTGLIRENTDVVGVTARDREHDERIQYQTRLVVGADGRYSTIRKQAGIDPNRRKTAVDVLWFKLPAETIDPDTIGRVEADGILGYFPLGDEMQIGLVIRSGTYAELRDQGIGAVADRVAAIDPTLETPLQNYLTSFQQCTRLDPSPGLCEEWSRDGLVLIGDAAHIANPFGAQGNSLAIQDAVVAHPHIVRALRNTTGTVQRRQVLEFERQRRDTVETIMATQSLQTTAIEAYAACAPVVPDALLARLLQLGFATACRHPFVTRRYLRRYAFGPGEISVATEYLN